MSSMIKRDLMKKNISTIDKDEWNTIVKEDSNSTIFHRYEWGSIMETIHNQNFFCLKQRNCIFPLSYVRSIIFGDRLISMPFGDYGGVSCKNVNLNDVNQLISETKKIADELDVDFIEIRAPAASYIPFFEKNGFLKRNDYITFKLDLQKGKDELWSGLDHKRRNVIRRANEKELVFSEGDNSGALKEFYQLYIRRMKGIGSPPQPFKYFEMLWSEFYPDHLKIPLTHTKDGDTIACGLFLLYRDTIYHLYGASSPEYWELKPNDFLLWNVIERNSGGDYRTLDLGRSRLGSGVYLYKKKWGGTEIQMPYLYYFRKKELKKRQEIQYERFSALWSEYMPIFLSKLIGPWLIKQIG
jgi:FemAB-related protein (PEP-CTERM system-associated)